MNREDIIKIADDFLDGSNIVACYGTNIRCSEEILKDGLNYKKNNIVLMHPNVRSQVLASFGDKEIVDDPCNIVISIPCEFFSMLFSLDKDEVVDYLDRLREEGLDEWMINSICDNYFDEDDLPTNSIPKEFIAGRFIYLDGMSFVVFENNLNEACNHIKYEENRNFFTNLSAKEKEEFVLKIKDKLNLK